MGDLVRIDISSFDTPNRGSFGSEEAYLAALTNIESDLEQNIAELIEENDQYQAGTITVEVFGRE